jgi:hypothetical protein
MHPCLGQGGEQAEEEGASGSLCEQSLLHRQQNPSCRGEAAAFPTDNLMTLVHFHQPNLEDTVGICASGSQRLKAATESNYR